MLKGFTIFFAVLLCVGIVHWVSLRLVRTSKVRAKKLRTIFGYFYGNFFIIFGLVRFFDADSSKVLALIQVGIGLAILILAAMGKLNEGVKE
ncbi:MAG: hypothetical protein WBM56_11600 [Robiginitalea sp.]|uniref:hypothetical protein n=1 Tax=Robiginitalea sp. TaxID=1902411 RepID=UPI003C71AA4E